MQEYLSWRLTCSGKDCLTFIAVCRSCATPTLALINGHVYQGHHWFIVDGRVCFLLTAVFPMPSHLRNTWQMNEQHSILGSTCLVPATWVLNICHPKPVLLPYSMGPRLVIWALDSPPSYSELKYLFVS